MKRILAILLSLTLLLALCACGNEENTTSDTKGETKTSVAEAVTDKSVSAAEATGDFSVKSDDGVFQTSDGVCTISAAGTYTLEGLFKGQILIEAGEEDEIVLELCGVTVTCGKDSPIKILSAGKVEISAQSDTENVINDDRSAKKTDSEDQGEGAIYAKCDLKLKGTGTLVVNGNYNNGIHTTKDLTIQKLALKCTATGNAIKGNDSVTVKSGTVVAISTGGDGIKTQNTDVDKNGATRGDIVVSGGSVAVYAAGDGFQAARNFELTTGEDGVEPSVAIYTASYSGYTASDASTTSYKGVKAKNEVNILSGSITIQSYDDGLHADYGTSLDDGTKGKGNVNISGGSVTMSVYAPQTKTAGGRMGPGSWGGQQTVSGADAIHADNTLNISGGTLRIDSAYEGLEANVINISGGTSYVSANDDGVNACKGNSTPQVNVTGGYLDVAVPINGDTDGIDSNGTYTQTGGIVITRGPNNQNMAAIDADRTVTVSGGTLIVLGYGRVSTGGNVKAYSLSLHASGSHTVTIDGTSYTFENAYAYGSTACYSDVSVTA